MEVCPGSAGLFGDAALAIEVGVGAVCEDLGESGVEVEGVAGGNGVHGLLQSVAHPVVGKAVADPSLGYTSHSVGGIVGVGAYAVAEQVAVGIPGIGYAASAGHTVGDVVGVVGCTRVGGLALAVANFVINVLEQFTTVVAGVCQAVERVVGVGDGFQVNLSYG